MSTLVPGDGFFLADPGGVCDVFLVGVWDRFWDRFWLENSPINLTSWWLNHPFEKYARQNGFIFPKERGEKKNI